MRNPPLCEVELLSTHDQILGGPSGQSYLGCVFPADNGYAPLITREAAKIGRRLAKGGVLGRYALDFVVVRSPGEDWRAYAIEVNLEAAVFSTPSRRVKHYVASDHLESSLYRALTPDDLFDITVRHGLHLNQSTQTGVVFHMMATLSEQGRLGLTAIADSRADAEALYRRVVRVLDGEATEALRG